MTGACVYPLSFYFRVARSIMDDQKKDTKVPAHGWRVHVTEGGRSGRDRDEISLTPFDQWLNDKLIELYGPVLREPIPDDLIELLQAHRRSSKDN